uniref:NTP_transf_2 domain-containing protein n=1 Tax=Macrostomum lignano TaxID=282301 RepID=A0A1I8JFC0_9PLAT
GCLVEQFTLDSLRGKRVFFLYGESQKRQKKLESAVVYYGGSVASFFSNEVDLIIADDSAVSIEAKQSFSEFSRGFTMQQRAVTQTSSSQCRIVKTFEDILTKARLLQIPVYTPAIFRDRIRDQVSQHELCQKTISSGRFAEEDRNLTPPAVVVTDAQHLLRPIFKDNIDVVDIFANPRANNNDEKNRQKPDGKEKRKGRKMTVIDAKPHRLAKIVSLLANTSTPSPKKSLRSNFVPAKSNALVPQKEGGNREAVRALHHALMKALSRTTLPRMQALLQPRRRPHRLVKIVGLLANPSTPSPE